MKLFNFSPGPATLPKEVFQEASEALLNYKNTGLSVAEISHRAPLFVEIIEEATALVKELYALTENWEVLWLPGGASQQLAVTPMNFVKPNQKIGFVNTGFWAQRAMDAAAEIAQIEILDSAQDTNFDRIPKVNGDLGDLAYLHVVSNETIDGLQYAEYPNVSVPLVADLTSDFLTRPLLLEKFAVIFASAQKSFGIAGITCVLVNKNYLPDHSNHKVPTIFDFHTHIKEQSLYHTVPTYPVFVSLLMLRWIKKNGGLIGMQANAQQRAKLMYDEIDQNPLLFGITQKEDRSLMNACFKMHNPYLEPVLLKYLEENGIVGIKGFPTVGGFRASMYNGMPIEGIEYLVELLQNFKA